VNEYDIGAAFKEIEDELIASMVRNMEKTHRKEEEEKGFEWSQWQVEQLKSLERYKADNRKKYEGKFKQINREIEALIRTARDVGNMDQEIAILRAIKNGFKGAKKASRGATAEFFKLNDRKLEALIKATTDDMQRAETAILRMANDQYRKAIFNAQVYANTGAGTYEKAVDMATKDLLSRGLTCVEYSNGARHTLKDYADMAIRTASKRAYLTGEGEKRLEWGIHTVIVNKRGNPCPKCLPFCGKVLIDDVWSGGSEEDGAYPLMSHAVAAGLYHPRCKDSHTTYFPGISTADDTWTKEELAAAGGKREQIVRRQYAKRQFDKYQRLAAYSLDSEHKNKYKLKAAQQKNGDDLFSIMDDVKTHREDTPRRLIELVEKYTADNFITLNNTADIPYVYNLDLDVVEINQNHPLFPTYDYRETMIHEIAHRIDHNEFGSPMNLKFSKAIQKAEKDILAQEKRYSDLFDPGGKYEYNMLISDIIGCVTDNVVVGYAYHESQYIGIPGFTELEVFADMFATLYLGDDESVEFVKNELSEVYQAFMEIVGE